ncbi:MAG: TatD family hydrolase [Chloroflexi bacterium]|nr:TatD family hydrolase [Chloroflexota bacterium]
MYKLIDTHCHLDEVDQVDTAINRAIEAGVTGIIAVGQDMTSNLKTLEIAEKHKNFVFPGIGLHPGKLPYLTSSLEQQLKFIDDNAPKAVAIGEIGLDYNKSLIKEASKDYQKEVLSSLLEIAKRHNKPICIHSRYAWRDCYNLVKDAGVNKVVFHWFTGPSSILTDILNNGYMISATLAAEYHYEHKMVISETRIEQLMLETDSPVSYRGLIAQPADVVRSLNAVSALKNLPLDFLAETTTNNAINFFKSGIC